MTSLLDKYGRLALDVTSAGTSLGFAAAKAGTKLGFGITRGIVSTAAGWTGCALDVPFGGRLGAGQTFGNVVSSAINYIEQLALLPILFGESLTSASLVAAYSTINALSTFFPGSDEASFSLASFITLVRREWNEPALEDHLPEERFGVAEVAQALVAWGALQNVTYDWQIERWRAHLREMPFHDGADTPRARTGSRISITSDRMLQGNRGQLLTADITEITRDGLRPVAPPHAKPRPLVLKPLRQSNRDLKHTLRRLSKMVLAGYGGASLLFFGVPLIRPTVGLSPIAQAETSAEQSTLEMAVDASEAQAAQSSSSGAASGDKPLGTSPTSPPTPGYSWWNVLLGRHDRDIFLQSVRGDTSREKHHHISAVVGLEERMPRYWVLTDHSRRQIVLVFRGTMSLNEIAVDLTCEPEEFDPASYEDDNYSAGSGAGESADGEDSWWGYDPSDNESTVPGGLPFPSLSPGIPFPPRSGGSTRSSRTLRMRTPSFASIATFTTQSYHVHGGMLQMAKMMGLKGQPVHTAVRDALKNNRGYELVMCGHSLGSGVAALLGMMWADPRTCLTVRSSGLPVNRRVSVYCFGPPCLTDARLSKLAENMVTSFVYSHDVVSRLSLGSIRDMNRAAAWLCKAQSEGAPEGYSGVTKRALKHKAGFGSSDDPVWFLSVRKTLEANMLMTHLYPPGRVMWAVRRGDMEHISPPTGKDKYRAPPDPGTPLVSSTEQANALRLFEVLDVERVFSQIVFSRDMLSAHLPHQYDKVLEDLL